MATIQCPDCKNIVSDAAAACPHCARPHPGLTLEQIKSKNDEDGCSTVIGIVWLLHALYVMFKVNFVAGLISLAIGPFIWLFVR